MLMTCRHVRQLHHAYVDGELSSSMMAEVHAHLLQCPECQRQVEMTRVCGSVVAEDRSSPVLDSGFASRVVAEMQARGPIQRSVLETRRARRQRLWRVVLNASLPAAAAVLLFSVLIWPTGDSEVSRKMVAGSSAVRASGVAGVVSPTLDAVGDTRKAAESLNQLVQIAGDEATRGVGEKLQEVRGESAPTLFDVLWKEPFRGWIEPVESVPVEAGEDSDIVRF